jgi:hypothetical protein
MKTPPKTFISMGAKCVILVTNRTCYVWMGTHICSDVDNVQVVAFGVHKHNSMGAKCIILVTKTTPYVWLHTHM